MKTLIIAITLFPMLCYGQILTQEENLRWFDSLKVMQLPQQLHAIHARAVSDTNIYYNTPYCRTVIPARTVISLPEPDKKHLANTKPLFTINNCFFFHDYIPDRAHLLKFQYILSQVKIDSIIIFQGDAATAIYGATALNGVVTCVVKDKKDIKRLKRIIQSRE